MSKLLRELRESRPDLRACPPPQQQAKPLASLEFMNLKTRKYTPLPSHRDLGKFFDSGGLFAYFSG